MTTRRVAAAAATPAPPRLMPPRLHTLKRGQKYEQREQYEHESSGKAYIKQEEHGHEEIVECADHVMNLGMGTSKSSDSTLTVQNMKPPNCVFLASSNQSRCMLLWSARRATLRCIWLSWQLSTQHLKLVHSK